MLIELFSLGRTAEALRAIIGSKSAISLQRGPVDPKFHVEGVAPTNHSFSHKTRVNDLSHGIKIWTDLRFITIHVFGGRTDGQTDRNLIARPRLHSMQRGKNAPKCRIYRKKIIFSRRSTAHTQRSFLSCIVFLAKSVAKHMKM